LARRGGSVVTFLRFGTELYTPSILEGSGNLMVAFEPLEALRYVKFMNRNGVLIVNTYKIMPIECDSSGVGNRTYPDIKKILAIFTKQFKQIIALNATSLAEELGNPIVMNSILLGSVAASKVLPIPKKTFKEELRTHLPPKLISINSKAFEIGYKRAKAT
ncbi:indolepyruvate oxidoreductase subunit beta, partial [bacterium]|nr:indolepyruvate oxidoreductase subunit beta [bacterium]